MNINDSEECFDLDWVQPWRRHHLVFTSVFSLCAVGGVLGNLLVVVVYRREGSRAWPAVYVQALAVVDMVVCGVVIPYTIVAELRQVTDDVACRVLELTRHTLVIFSFYILSAVAVERYLAVFPAGEGKDRPEGQDGGRGHLCCQRRHCTSVRVHLLRDSRLHGRRT
ncbi:hypothetical protein C0Q70_17984 [Pomacea canaliculata]|uniref:G-protein coupled receptors family 1 profile domain-containing protein n=1 Tax=Pomacea canaliculata TaxID=400727 RepID=A0A2T7NLY5_POMCA|nr:hypothetical protein C0Q70_17984 [Pomacea canaliculata]